MKYLLSLFCLSFLFGQDLAQAIKDYENKQFDKAKSVLEQITENDESNAEALYYLGLTYLELDDLDEAIDYVEEAVELAPNNSEYHYKLGMLYAKDIEDASVFRKPFLAGKIKDQFIRTIELDPKHLKALNSMARFYANAPAIAGGDMDKAIEHAKRVKQLDLERGIMLMFDIHVQNENDMEADKAMQDWLKNYGKNPKQYTMYNRFGYYLMGKERLDDAIVMFKKQIDLAPNEANPYDSYGEALRKKGLLKESLAMYKKALSINPDFENAQNAVEELEDELNE